MTEDAPKPSTPQQPKRRVRSDLPFLAGLCILSSTYIFLILAMLIADASYTSPDDLMAALKSPEIQFAIKLSLISCTITTILSLWVAVPIGYLMSRYQFRGKGLLDAILDIPIVLPPLVVGLSLLILFSTRPGTFVENAFENITGARITYAAAGVILAQFMVACAFAVRTMRATFEEITTRREQVALTLGCSRSQAFWMVSLPEARSGLVVAATLAWARSLGEFGPILIFAGATRMKTEVLPTTVFLEMSVGNIEGAVAVSLLMIVSAMTVLGLVRLFGSERFVR
ncbi:MAG: ABC transporter permease [Candidatus Hydrogenedentota bacterium]